jgi:hypothetical protein
MNTVSFCSQRNIGPVIHDKGHTLRDQQQRKPFRGCQDFARGRLLVPVLQQPDTGSSKFISALCFGNGKQCCV